MQSVVDATSEDALCKLNQELMGITRYNIVARYFQSPDMDFALTLRAKHRKAQKTSLLSPFCKKRVPLQWFFKSKYILSLTGNDTGSNFLMAANSNSVVLKEEDGWELFYSGEFRAWEHYIPLASGALDLEEKLAWARENQAACIDMTRAAQDVCRQFASAEYRREYLSEILANL